MKKTLAVVLVLLVCSTAMFGQLKKGAMGVTTSFSPVSNALGVAYALQENMRINAAVGFRSVSSSGGSNFGVGVGLWYYMATAENVSTFVGAGFGFESITPPGANASSSTGITLNGDFGAEYWFSPRFSWNGYLMAGFGSSGSPSVSTIQTGMGTGLTWYFN